MPKHEQTVKAGREMQDNLIRYLSDARLRKHGAGELPLSEEQARRAEKFSRFLARRYYRDRLVRSFRYSRLFALAGHTAEGVVDAVHFQNFLDECVLGSLEAARRLGEMAVVYLTVPNAPGPWWGELLEYEQGFFLQAATADHGPPTHVPRRGTSALCSSFHWNLPEILACLKSGQAIGDDLKKDVVLLFSRTVAGKIFVVEVEKTTELVWRDIDGLRGATQIAAAAALPLETVQNILQALSEIGAVVLPPA
jgi:hypothetical protein